MNKQNINFRFVEMGGTMRPVCFNFNVQADLKRRLMEEHRDTVTDLEAAMRKRMDEAGRDLTTEELQTLSEEHAEIEDVGYVRMMIFLMMKEGYRKAGKEFKTTRVTYEPDEDGIPVKTVTGRRRITELDVGDWLDEADSDAIQAILDVQEAYQMTAMQKEQMQKHQARAAGSDDDFDAEEAAKND